MMEFMSDRAVAHYFGMAVETLRKHLRQGPPPGSDLDVRKIKYIRIGVKRRWLRTAVLKEGERLGYVRKP